MAREEIIIDLQEIFRDIFDDLDLIITDSTNSNEIEDWDSLEQINILLSIEKKFNIKFNLDEALEFKNVGDMINLIERKRN